jgi:hypothetical protein
MLVTVLRRQDRLGYQRLFLDTFSLTRRRCGIERVVLRGIIVVVVRARGDSMTRLFHDGATKQRDVGRCHWLFLCEQCRRSQDTRGKMVSSDDAFGRPRQRMLRFY